MYCVILGFFLFNIILDAFKEAKKITSFKSQIDLYKKQLQELHENLLGQEMKVKKYEYENKRYEERLLTIQQEKERLNNELNTLRETNEELQIKNAISSETKSLNIVDLSNDKSFNDSNLASELELFNLPPGLKLVYFIFDLTTT